MTAHPAPTATLRNATAISLRDVPALGQSEFRSQVIETVRGGGRIVALFGRPSDADQVRVHAVLAPAAPQTLAVFCMDVADRYPALTPECPQAHWFERELAEQWGLRPDGHPWLKPIRFHRSYRPGHDAWNRPPEVPILPSVFEPFRVHGEEIHEVAVGPVHAGIIEPGHFRFQCHGEHVFHLEISLGYQHRGVENALRGGPDKRSIHYAETLAGDTTIGHTMAYSQAVEALTGIAAPPRAQLLRAIALELERLANHTGDLGALAGDVGFLPTMSFCGRIRGDYLNLTALLCGNRFGRGLVRPGGVLFDVDPPRLAELLQRLDAALRDVTGAADLLWNTSSVQARFEGTGTVAPDVAREIGLVGVAARASGLERDIRSEFPFGFYERIAAPMTTAATGDVYARAWVRWLEIRSSAELIGRAARELPDGPIRADLPPRATLAPNSLAVSLTEGWRGEICHVAITDSNGRFAAYKVVDPSFHNWFGLALALRDQQISDFPLCNKSFNLSYCGHDL